MDVRWCGRVPSVFMERWTVPLCGGRGGLGAGHRLWRVGTCRRDEVRRRAGDSVVSDPGPVRAADGQGRRYGLHLFVCVNEAACVKDGPAHEIRKHLKTKVREAGLKHELRVNQASCLGQCGHGPMMVVYPEGVWYSHLSVEDADRIWDEHVIGGRPVEGLLYATQEKGGNVVPMADPDARVPDTESRYWSPCSRCPS